MDVNNLIILHSQVTPRSLEICHLHVHRTRQRHPNGIGIVISISSPARDQRNVQPGHNPLQLLLHAARAGNGPIVDEIIPTPLPPLIPRNVLVRRKRIQQRDVIARGIRELRLGLVGGLGGLPRSHEHLGDAHGRHDVHDLLGAIVVGTAEEHLRQLGVQRQFGHLTSEIGHVALVVEGSEVIQHLQRAHQRFGSGRVHEIEVHQVVDPQFFERQHHVGHFAAQNFGIRRLLQIVVEALFGVQSKALSRTGSSRASRSLTRRRPRDGTDQQRLHPNPRIVHLLLAKSRIDDVHDAVDGQRRLGDVRRHHHLPSRRPSHDPRTRSRREDLLLLRGGQRRVQRVHDELGGVLSHVLGSQSYLLARLFDLLFSREEDEYVAGSLAFVYLYGRAYCRLDVISFRFGRVEDFDGEGPSRDLEEGGIVEVRLEFFGVERRGHDDHLELSVLAPLPPLREDLHQQSHEHVGRERPFVRLVQHYHGIPTEHRIAHRLSEQHPIREKFEHRLVRANVLESNRVSHRPAQFHVHLLGDARGDGRGGHPPRLGACHARPARLGVSHLDEKLGYLRGLSAPGFSLHDDRLTGRHRLEELGLEFVYREFETGLEDGLVAGGVRASGPWVDFGGLAGVEACLVSFGYVIGVEFDFSFAFGGPSHGADVNVSIGKF
mmetsp:Transcript_12823/g.27654  ORF Transcript_12823/g.27654 Transcript_12823/m.27654 type:complete len:661 (-) Transcript_12823:60-2042(-)